MAANALIGYTGFVGGHLADESITHQYNSKNISEIAGQTFDRCYCAGVAGIKWKANKEPSKDLEGIERLKAELEQMTCETMILISTISVYDVTHGDDVDERRDVWRAGAAIDEDIFSRGYTPYGVNRAELEKWVKENTVEGRRYRRCLIVRLPGLFGTGLSKNYIFDLLAETSYLHKVDLATCHQWYHLRLLRGDIEVALNDAEQNTRHVTVLNLFPEPVPTMEIVSEFFPHTEDRCKRGNKDEEGFSFLDDVKTMHWSLFEGGVQGYRYSKERFKAELRLFLQQEEARAEAVKPPPAPGPSTPGPASVKASNL